MEWGNHSLKKFHVKKKAFLKKQMEIVAKNRYLIYHCVCSPNILLKFKRKEDLIEEMDDVLSCITYRYYTCCL